MLGRELDVAWTECGPVRIEPGEKTVVCDGMWLNPNHFLRVRLYIEALAATGTRVRLLGILRTSSDAKARRALEQIGFTDFVFLEDDDDIRREDSLAEADRLLGPVRSHADLLAMRLPHDLPAYVYYDTVLKLAAHPQPPLDNPLWRSSLASTLRDLALYERELSKRQIHSVALSHPWKSEWGTLVWLALGRGIPALHLTGFVEGMRVRRFRNRTDYRNPVEFLDPAEFDRLSPEIRDDIASVGARALEQRAAGTSSDINARHAFRLDRRIEDRAAARLALGARPDRPLCVVYSHVWYDFPHTFAMANFTDFRDWMETTISAIRPLTHIHWVLKPHPTEEWYGGFRLRDLVGEMPTHIHLLSSEVDNATVLRAADAIVTVHGTVGLEAAAFGKPVLLADRSYFSEWGFAHVATSREHYIELLSRAGTLTAPDGRGRNRARAAFALALATPPADTGAMPMSCDSLGSTLFRDVITLARTGRPAVSREARRLADFLTQNEIDSFAAFQLIEASRRRVSAAHKATR